MISELEKYLTAHTSPQEEGLAWIEKQTHLRTNVSQMLAGPVQGRLLRILAEVSGARRILEIGTFTGYSAASLALGAGPDAHVDTLEINDELVDLILEGWRRCGVSDRITLHSGNALQTLSEFGESTFDLVFIDADKREYPGFYALCKPLLRKGGLMIVDDVLWGGKILGEDVPSDAKTSGITGFNDMVAGDPDVEVVVLPLRHGLSLIRKK